MQPLSPGLPGSVARPDLGLILVRVTLLGALAVTTGTPSEAQGAAVRDALRSQRPRLSTLLATFDDVAWSAPSRCTEWNVHEVVRHLCDMTQKTTALLRGANPQDVGTSEVDPRTTPLAWLSRSGSERPQETLDVFRAASAQLMDEVERCLRGPAETEVAWFYGPVPWSTAACHLLWDAWVHERDIVLPLTRPQECPAVESRPAAAYGLLMASIPALVTGACVSETVVLTGAGGGAFLLDARPDAHDRRQLTAAGYPADGTVTISVSDTNRTNHAQPLIGALEDVIDSLVGRGPDLATVLHGPPERVERLGVLRSFMLQPAPPN